MRLAITLVLAACQYSPQRSAPMIIDDDGGPTASDAPADTTTVPPDMMVLPPCPPAPSGCTLFECEESTSCYYECAPRSWTSARDQCATDQIGCLATINSTNEDACLFTNTSPITFPDLVWFGYRQAANQATPISGWDWECGSSSYLAPNWGATEPNDSNGSENNSENCASIGSGGAWIDISCGDSRRYVCELGR
jgi:hypothetical protein